MLAAFDYMNGVPIPFTRLAFATIAKMIFTRLMFMFMLTVFMIVTFVKFAAMMSILTLRAFAMLAFVFFAVLTLFALRNIRASSTCFSFFFLSLLRSVRVLFVGIFCVFFCKE